MSPAGKLIESLIIRIYRDLTDSGADPFIINLALLHAAKNAKLLMEQLQVNLIDGEEVDVKAVLSFSTTVMKSTEFMAIEEVTEQEIDSAVLAELPSAVIYITAPGDDLWSIGRKYHMPVKAVRELNALESDELKPGRKLLLVKGL